VSIRVLVVITEGQERAVVASLPAIALVARAERSRVRLAYFRDLPGPRVDASDRVVVPAALAMERVEAAAVDALATAARAFDDVVMEPVVRFGTPRREVALEADALGSNLVVFIAPRGARPLARLRAWALRRRVARRGDLRVLVLQSPAPEVRRQDVMRPRWHRMAGELR
jgi:hypothetical protein